MGEYVNLKFTKKIRASDEPASQWIKNKEAELDEEIIGMIKLAIEDLFVKACIKKKQEG